MRQEGILERALDLIDAVIETGRAELPGLHRATAHRIATRLVDTGHLIAVGRGRYLPGGRPASVWSQLSPARLAAEAARPVMRAAVRGGCSLHLGAMEDEMVRYLVKEGSPAIFTQEGMLLEAYASAIGKALLSRLSSAERRAYFDAGTLVGLTERTVTDQHALSVELDEIAARGHAVDDGGIIPGLYCVAKALPHAFGGIQLALSLSVQRTDGSPPDVIRLLRRLSATVNEVSEMLDGYQAALQRTVGRSFKDKSQFIVQEV